MSLIQDALKRKEEEAANQPPQHTPEPEPEKRPTQPKTHTVLLMVLIILLFLTLLAGAAIYLIRRPPPPAEKTAADPAARPETPLSVLTTNTPAGPAMPAEPPAAAPEPESDPAPEPEPAPEPAPALNWPELELSGIASSGTHRIAIINGKMLSAGRTLGEVIVRDVRETEVVVEYRGEHRTLYVNE